jgi:hypothetical protein
MNPIHAAIAATIAIGAMACLALPVIQNAAGGERYRIVIDAPLSKDKCSEARAAFIRLTFASSSVQDKILCEAY